MSSKRKISETTNQENKEFSSKRQKEIPYTSTDNIKKNFVLGDKSACIVAYVDDILGEQTFINRKTQEEFKIFKFILNNNHGVSVQCNMYNDNIAKFSPDIKVYDKLLIENLSVTQSKTYTKGNVPLELNIQNFSSITSLGTFDISPNKNIPECRFSEITEKKGIIKITGYLRNRFVPKNTKINKDLFGCITDGEYKLDVLIVNHENVTIEKGKKLTIVGDLQENGKTYILRVKEFENIEVLDEPKMELAKLINACVTFTIPNANENCNEDPSES